MVLLGGVTLSCAQPVNVAQYIQDRALGEGDLQYDYNDYNFNRANNEFNNYDALLGVDKSPSSNNQNFLPNTGYASDYYNNEWRRATTAQAASSCSCPFSEPNLPVCVGSVTLSSRCEAKCMGFEQWQQLPYGACGVTPGTYRSPVVYSQSSQRFNGLDWVDYKPLVFDQQRFSLRPQAYLGPLQSTPRYARTGYVDDYALPATTSFAYASPTTDYEFARPPNSLLNPSAYSENNFDSNWRVSRTG